MSAARNVKHVPTLCYNCVSGPDFMKVKVEDGIATEIEPNFDAQGVQKVSLAALNATAGGQDEQQAPR